HRQDARVLRRVGGLIPPGCPSSLLVQNRPTSTPYTVQGRAVCLEDGTLHPEAPPGGAPPWKHIVPQPCMETPASPTVRKRVGGHQETSRVKPPQEVRGRWLASSYSGAALCRYLTQHRGADPSQQSSPARGPSYHPERRRLAMNIMPHFGTMRENE